MSTSRQDDFESFFGVWEKAGLLRLNPLDVTPAGDEYVDEFEHFLKFLEKYGLAPKSSSVQVGPRCSASLG